ncbi:hypothetical protein PSTT_06227 [Puccinia striiformis]|uniref:Ubiquitin-like protease family profile domain-containing protein n=2 Tax=Puccinia striiformis TaxID=27350 RepID=A0A2S4VKW3_9BASI|nr:hypothetical protein PSTT_06227 [Puccinia striiformis]
MSSSFLEYISRSGKLSIGIFEDLSQEESSDPNSSSKSQPPSTITSLHELTSNTRPPPVQRQMPYQRRKSGTGKPIHPGSDAPESHRSHRAGEWSTDVVANDRAPITPTFQSSNFKAVNSSLGPSTIKRISATGNTRRNSNPLHTRSTASGNQILLKGPNAGTESSSLTATGRLFKKAYSSLQDRQNTSQGSTSKQTRNIKGAAAKAVTKNGGGKGKAKAVASLETTIDLTEEEEHEISIEQGHQNPNSLNAIDDVFGPLNENPRGSDDSVDGGSDDPMRIQKRPKRIDNMKGKDSKNTNKSSAQQSHKNGQNRKPIKSSTISVKLKRIKFAGAQVGFDESQSCEMKFESNHDLVFTVNTRTPSKLGRIKMRLDQINRAFYSKTGPVPAQLVLHFQDGTNVQERFKHYISGTPSRRLSPLDACHIDVFDSSENCHMSEIVEAIGRTGHVKITYGRIPDNYTSSFRQDSPPDDHHFDPSDEPESLPSRRPIVHSSTKPSPSSHAHSERSNQKFSPQLSTLPPSLYRKSNQTLESGFQNVDTQKTLDGTSQQTVDSQSLKFTHSQLDHLDSNLCKSTQKKIDARQELQDGHVTNRHNTRNNPPRLSTQLPVKPRADLPVAPSINGADSDIVLIWPFEAERNSQSVAITNGDLKRLAEGEFLNDTLIEFGLLWELSEIRKRDPELVTSIHLFNSFFFQKLSGCKSKEKTAAGEAEAYAGVRKWTKGINVFQKDFLVIPINEHMHWYFMIVANPGRLLDPEIQTPGTNLATSCAPMQTRLSQKVEGYVTRQSCPAAANHDPKKSCYFSTSDELSKANSITAAQATAAGEGQTSNSNSNVNVAVETSAQALQEMELDDQKSPVQEDTTTADAPTTGAKQDASLPYVLTLDSLGSPHRPQSSTILRYLINEAKDKLEQTLPESLSKSVCIKKVPVPEQPNFCDCGLYLIHAFKTFFKEPKGMLRWILDHNNKKGPKEQRLAEVCETWNAAGAAQARQALRDQIQALRPQYDELARRRKEAAAEKKQARMRKLADIEGPQASNPESAKKQPLDQSEPNDHNTRRLLQKRRSNPAPGSFLIPKTLRPPTPSRPKSSVWITPDPMIKTLLPNPSTSLITSTVRHQHPRPSAFLKGVRTPKRKVGDMTFYWSYLKGSYEPDIIRFYPPSEDQLFHRLSTSSITKTFSPCPAQDQRSIEDIPDQRDIIVDVSPDPTPPKDDSMDMLDDRPVTPDDDLILTGIPIPLMSPRTPENSPPGDQKPSETKKDVPDRQIVGVPATPPEEPDYDGEALAPEQPEENAVIDPSSPLSDAESSIRMASPQPTPTSRRSSRRENTTIGSATQNPRSAEAIAGSTSRPGGENFTKQSKGGLPPQDNMFHLFNIHSAHNHHNRTHRPNDHNNNTSNNNNNNTSNNNNNHTNNKNKSNNHPNNSYTRNPHHPQNQSHKNKNNRNPNRNCSNNNTHKSHHFNDKPYNHNHHHLNHNDQNFNYNDQNLNYNDQNLNYNDQNMNHNDQHINQNGQHMNQNDKNPNHHDKNQSRDHDEPQNPNHDQNQPQNPNNSASGADIQPNYNEGDSHVNPVILVDD